MGCSYAIRNRVELDPEPEPEPAFDEERSEKLKPCKTLRAIMAARTCLNVIVEERREPVGTGVGDVKSCIRP
jgi:hypothetical protein